MRTLSWLVATSTVLAACSGTAGDPDPDFSIAPGFESESRGPFESHGDVEDTTCGGWFPANPQHVVTMEANFLELTFQTDTAAAPFRVESDRGSWCSDTDSSSSPAVWSGAWSAGDYQVYVGATESGGSASYDLTLAEGAPE